MLLSFLSGALQRFRHIRRRFFHRPLRLTLDGGALFGTRFVVESRMFGMLDGIDVLVPNQVDEIHQAYMQTVEGGAEGRDALTKIAHQLPVDAIVLAGTDLSLIFDETNTDFPHVDGAKVHIQAILRKQEAVD